MRQTKPEQADIAVAHAVAPARDSVAVTMLGRISELADQPPLISICVATFAAGLILRDARLARAGGRMLAAELTATKLKGMIKHRVDRTRPKVLADGGAYKAARGHDHASAMNSFPSGHTTGAVAVAIAYAREYPEHAAAAFGIAAAVGAIQIPRTAHYPTDVAAGAIVGVVAERIVHGAEALLRRSLG